MPLTALALNGTLKRSGGDKPSSTDRLIGEIGAALAREDVTLTETIRLADHDIKPGVKADEGDGDAWPPIRAKILAADILIAATPIWVGHPSSLIKRALERMDAFFSEKDEHGRMPPFGKVAAVAVVGNEDGAHHVAAELFKALNDFGFTLPPNALTYWVGEVQGSTNYVDLDETPKPVDTMTRMLARNAAHLARLLKASCYPGLEPDAA